MSKVMAPGSAIVAPPRSPASRRSPNRSDLSLTKHAVVGFVRSTAPQFGSRGIRICAVAPGIVDTPLIGQSRTELEEAAFPLLEAAEVARWVVQLAREGRGGRGVGDPTRPGAGALPLRQRARGPSSKRQSAGRPPDHWPLGRSRRSCSPHRRRTPAGSAAPRPSGAPRPGRRRCAHRGPWGTCARAASRRSAEARAPGPRGR